MLVVAGIDPGSRVTGIGIVSFNGSSPAHLYHCTVRLSERVDFPGKCELLHSELKRIFGEYGVTLCALERAFVSKNAASALKLGVIRGAVLLTCALSGVETLEISPREVKLSLTGYGNADKYQVRGMVSRLLGIGEEIPLDASDALAIAISAGFQRMSNLGKGGI